MLRKLCAFLALMLAVSLPLGSVGPKHQTHTLKIVSSWYCEGFSGKLMANGKPYDCQKHTVAHRAWPFGTQLRLRNPDNGRVARVTVTDRGPYIDGRGLDVSEKVAELLHFKKKGVTLLEVQVVAVRPSNKRFDTELK